MKVKEIKSKKALVSAKVTKVRTNFLGGRMMERKNVTIWTMVVVLCLASSPVLAVVEFKDGLTHNIDYEINDTVRVDYIAPGIQTTVNLLDGGSISGYYDLQAHEDSRINILGGAIGDNLFAYDRSQVDFSGGSIGWMLNARDSSRVSFSGGVIGDRMNTNHTSQVDIYGGSIGAYLFVKDSSRVDMYGGSIGHNLMVYYSGTLTIHGSDFAVDGVPFGYGELTSILGGWWEDEPFRNLTGALVSGELIDNGFYIGHNAKIILVPEPATVLLLGLGGLALRLRSGQALRRKHRAK